MHQGRQKDYNALRKKMMPELKLQLLCIYQECYEYDNAYIKSVKKIIMLRKKGQMTLGGNTYNMSYSA